jgi:hypothetical protein
MSGLTAWKELILIWFPISVVTHIFSGVGLWLWLVYNGVKTIFGFTGFPGYLERRYSQWAKSQGRSSRLVVNLRIVSTVNVIAAAMIAIPLLIGLHLNNR